MDPDYDSACSLASEPGIGQRADAVGVLWAKVGAHPWWPAQLLSEPEVESRPNLLKAKKNKKKFLPVQFFGEHLSVSWLAPPEVMSWAEGMQRQFYSNKQVHKGVKEVANFLSLESPVAPEGWWIAPGQGADTLQAAIQRNTPAKAPKAPASAQAKKVQKAKSAVGVLSANGHNTPSAATTVASQASLPPPQVSTLAVVNGKLVAPRSRCGAASKASAAAPGEGEEQIPAYVPDKNKPPSYIHIKQNVWVSRPRPKRLSKDEIAVCNCYPLACSAPGTLGRAHVSGRRSSLQEVAAPNEKTIPALEVLLNAPPQQMQQVASLPPALPVDDVQMEEADPDRLLARQITAAAVEAAIARLEGSSVPAPNPSVVEQLADCVAPSAPVFAAPAGRASRQGADAQELSRGPAATEIRDGCSEHCLNRLSFIHCDVRTCPYGERCGNRPFYQLPSPPMEVFLTADKGWGVRATEPIIRGTFVAEYAGEIIDDVEVAKRIEECRKKNEPHFYMMEMGPGLVIDARCKGNVARLLNSSCDPNCETQKWHDASTGEVRVGLFTIRDVAPGEELMYDYQFQHFGVASAGAAYQCTCGAPKCKGTMVHKDKEHSKDMHRRVDIWWEGDAQYYRGTVIGYNAGSGKHTILYDDGEVEKVPLGIQKHIWLDANGDALPVSPAKVMGLNNSEESAVAPAAKKARTVKPKAPKPKPEPIKVEAPAVAPEAALFVGEPSAAPMAVDEPQPAAMTSILAPELMPLLQQLLPPGMAIERIKLEQLTHLIGYSLPQLLEGVRQLQQLEQEQVQHSAEVQGQQVPSPTVPSVFASVKEVKEAVELPAPDAACPMDLGQNTHINEEAPAAVAVGQQETTQMAVAPNETDADADVNAAPMAVDARDAGPSPVADLLSYLGIRVQDMQQATRAAHLATIESGLLSLMKMCAPIATLPPVDNPGAEAVSGHLHGNGKGGVGGRRLGSDAAGRRKRSRRSYGDDFVVDEVPPAAEQAAGDEGAEEVVNEGTDVDAGADDQSAGAVPVAPVVHRIALGPTPASTGLPARTILVAKKLTHSDVSKGRILLPRAAVEANLSFAIGRAHSLSAKDHNGASWEFTLQSWANGMESRRVYVLEHAGDYIRHHVLKQEDVIGISCTPEGEFLVEFNTGEVRTAAETQQAARVNPAAVGPALPPVARDAANPLIQHNYGRCTRSEFCNKPAGHPGFCMRSAGGAAASRARGRKRGSGGRGRGRGRRPAATTAAMATAAAVAAAAAGPSGAAVDPNRPKRSRRPSYKATDFDGEEDEEEYYDEEDEDEEGFDGEDEDYDDAVASDDSDGAAAQDAAYGRGGGVAGKVGRPLVGHRPAAPLPPPALPHPHGARASTPPRDTGPGVPPIFVMAHDGNLPQMPPHLRSPLRPHLASHHTASAGRPGSQTSGGGPPSLTHQPSITSPAKGGAEPQAAPSPMKEDPNKAAAGQAPQAPEAQETQQQQKQQQKQPAIPSRAAMSVPAPVVAPNLPSPASLALPQPVAPPLPAVLSVGGTTFPPPSFLPQRGQAIPPIPPLSVPLFGAAPPPTGPPTAAPATVAVAAAPAAAGNSAGENAGQQQQNDFDVMSFLGQ